MNDRELRDELGQMLMGIQKIESRILDILGGLRQPGTGPTLERTEPPVGTPEPSPFAKGLMDYLNTMKPGATSPGAPTAPTQSGPADYRWGVCETACSSCEARHWTSAQSPVLFGPTPIRCPNCGHTAVRPVLDTFETITVPIGECHTFEVRIPRHQCDHSTLALRAISERTRDMRKRRVL